MINQQLSDSFTCIIVGMLPPSSEVVTDCPVCLGVHRSQFTVGNMYDILDLDNRLKKKDKWRKFWKLQTTRRVRNFVWILNHNGLFTNRRKNGVGQSNVSFL